MRPPREAELSEGALCVPPGMINQKKIKYEKNKRTATLSQQWTDPVLHESRGTIAGWATAMEATARKERTLAANIVVVYYLRKGTKVSRSDEQCEK